MNLQSLASENCYILLTAIDHQRNISREYEIYAALDLLGAFVVEYHWGRRGTKGQGSRQSFVDPRGAKRFVRKLLKRRESARARIGVAYKQVN